MPNRKFTSCYNIKILNRLWEKYMLFSLNFAWKGRHRIILWFIAQISNKSWEKCTEIICPLYALAKSGTILPIREITRLIRVYFSIKSWMCNSSGFAPGFLRVIFFSFLCCVFCFVCLRRIILCQIENSQVVITLKFWTDYGKNICYFHWTLHERDNFAHLKGK
jgi:hypothetical protein